jgi:hypothetical protein
MPPTVKQYDTYPPWIFILADDEGPFTLMGVAFAVKIVLKQVGGPTTVGPLAAAIANETTVTASTAANSPTLTGVSSLTGLFEGGTVVGPGIPENTLIQDIDTTANTITMSKSATATGASISVICNRGTVTYTPAVDDTTTTGTFNVEAAVHWDSLGTQVTKVPNTQAANPTIQIDPDLLGAAE